MKNVFGGSKKVTKKVTKKAVKKEKEIMSMTPAELKKKAEELDQNRDQKKLDRVEDVKNTSDAKKGCFVRNVMHRGYVFQAGEKLDPKHKDFAILKKHIA